MATVRAKLPPTKQQAKVLEYLKKYIGDGETSPTHGEIAKALKLKSSEISQSIVRELVTKGYVKKTKARTRNLKLTAKGLK